MTKTIYNDDDTLMNEIALLEAAYSFEDRSVIKNAGMLDDLKGVGQYIVDDVKGQIEREGPYVLLTYLAPSALGWLWGPLGWGAWFATFVADALGVSIGSVMAQAAKDTKAKLDSGEPFTIEDAEIISDNAIRAGGGEIVLSSFLPLRTMIKDGKLLSEARDGLEKFGARMPKGVLRGVFTKLIGAGSLSRARMLFFALLKWGIKNVIKAAALLGVTGYVTGQPPTGQQKPSEEKREAPRILETPRSISSKRALPPKQVNNLTPNPGVGVTHRINSDNRVWIVPLVGNGTGLNKIANTMFFWAKQVYQEVNETHRRLIMTSPAFIQMVSVLAMNYSPTAPMGLEMPHNEYLSAPIHSIKDVVDYFIWQTAPQIKGNL